MNGYHINVGDGMPLCQTDGYDPDHFLTCSNTSFKGAAWVAEQLCDTGTEARVVRAPCPHCAGDSKIKRKAWGAPGSKVSRQFDGTNGRDDNVFSGGKHRPLIVSLYPDGRIGLRLVRHRREEFITAATTYRIAAALRAGAEKRKRKAERKARRQA